MHKSLELFLRIPDWPACTTVAPALFPALTPVGSIVSYLQNSILIFYSNFLKAILFQYITRRTLGLWHYNPRSLKFESGLIWLWLRNSDRWRNGNTCCLEHLDADSLAFCPDRQSGAVFFQINFLKRLQVLLDIGPFKLEALADQSVVQFLFQH